MNRISQLLLSLPATLLLAAGCQPMYTLTPQEPQKTTPQPEPEPEPEPEEEPFESAADAVLHMGAGWNLGNTLDSNSGNAEHMWIEAWSSRKPEDYEKAWGQPQATRALMHMFKEAGFGAIRVPVTWYPHMGTLNVSIVNVDGEQHPVWDKSTWTGTEVDPAWMARVKEVVDYVLDEGMYCILNVHHDTGDASTAWLVASEAGFNAAKTRYQALWQQIASTFKDYGPRLLFESYNEMLDQYGSWCFASFAAPGNYDEASAQASYKAINDYARCFTETVRATGGNNAERNLIVNTYGACSGGGSWSSHLNDPLKQMALPEAPDHIAVQVHSYWDAGKFAQQKADIDKMFNDLDTHLAKRLNVPVIIGEWGGGTGEDSDANVQFASYFARKVRDKGWAALWWMGLSDGADRAVPTWTMPRTQDAIVRNSL